MILPPIVMPAEPVPSHWWAQLTFGSGEREVERDTAIKVCRLIVADALGALRAQSTPINFSEGAPVLLTDVHDAIQTLCGSAGWTALTKRGQSG
jgi:hypothetical protein